MLNMKKPNPFIETARKKLKHCLRAYQSGKVAESKKTFDSICKWIAEGKIACNIKTDCGNTPLHVAAYAGWLDKVELLVTSYAANDREDNNLRMMPIHLAAQKNQLAVFQYLAQLTKTNLTNKTGIGQTALHIAVAYGSLQIVQDILENHADMLLNLGDDMNALLLRLAEKTNQTEVLHYLQRKMGIAVEQKSEIVFSSDKVQSNLLIALAKHYQQYFKGKNPKSIKQKMAKKQETIFPVSSSCSSTITSPLALTRTLSTEMTVDTPSSASSSISSARSSTTSAMDLAKKQPFPHVNIKKIIFDLSRICHLKVAKVEKFVPEHEIRWICTRTFFEECSVQELNTSNFAETQRYIINRLVISTKNFLGAQRRERKKRLQNPQPVSATNTYVLYPTAVVYSLVPLTAQSLSQWMLPTGGVVPPSQTSSSYYMSPVYSQPKF